MRGCRFALSNANRANQIRSDLYADGGTHVGSSRYEPTDVSFKLNNVEVQVIAALF